VVIKTLEKRTRPTGRRMNFHEVHALQEERQQHDHQYQGHAHTDGTVRHAP